MNFEVQALKWMLWTFQITMGNVYRGRLQLTDEEVLAIYKRRHLTNDMVQTTVSHACYGKEK